MDKIIVVASTEQKTIAKGDNAGNMYLSVTAKDGKKYNIFNSAFWNFFQDGFAVKLIGEQSGQYFNVSGAEPVKDAAIIQAAKEAPIEIAPQELGMWYKEAGETLRTLSPDLKGHPMYIDLKNAYLRKMFEVLGIPIRHKVEEIPDGPIEPENIPF